MVEGDKVDAVEGEGGSLGKRFLALDGVFWLDGCRMPKAGFGDRFKSSVRKIHYRCHWTASKRNIRINLVINFTIQ